MNLWPAFTVGCRRICAGNHPGAANAGDATAPTAPSNEWSRL